MITVSGDGTQVTVSGDTIQVTVSGDSTQSAITDDTVAVTVSDDVTLVSVTEDTVNVAVSDDVVNVEIGSSVYMLHAFRHEDGGADEIDVTNLSGLLADAQTPLPHEATHQLGGSDVLDHGTLQGLGDNDHNQYALIDGTNMPFTGDVSIEGTVYTYFTSNCPQNFGGTDYEYDLFGGPNPACFYVVPVGFPIGVVADDTDVGALCIGTNDMNVALLDLTPIGEGPVTFYHPDAVANNAGALEAFITLNFGVPFPPATTDYYANNCWTANGAGNAYTYDGINAIVATETTPPYLNAVYPTAFLADTGGDITHLGDLITGGAITGSVAGGGETHALYDRLQVGGGGLPAADVRLEVLYQNIPIAMGQYLGLSFFLVHGVTPPGPSAAQLFAVYGGMQFSSTGGAVNFYGGSILGSQFRMASDGGTVFSATGIVNNCAFVDGVHSIVTNYQGMSWNFSSEAGGMGHIDNVYGLLDAVNWPGGITIDDYDVIVAYDHTAQALGDSWSARLYDDVYMGRTLWALGEIRSDAGFAFGAVPGATGGFTAATGEVVTVQGGIITSIV